MNNGFTYLCAPYSHHNPQIRELRYQMTNDFAARLMRLGFVVFSPISHSHEVAKYLDSDENTHKLWMEQDLPLLEKASRCIVLRLPGWEHSKGVTEEVSHAREHNIPIEYMDY